MTLQDLIREVPDLETYLRNMPEKNYGRDIRFGFILPERSSIKRTSGWSLLESLPKGNTG